MLRRQGLEWDYATCLVSLLMCSQTGRQRSLFDRNLFTTVHNNGSSIWFIHNRNLETGVQHPPRLATTYAFLFSYCTNFYSTTLLHSSSFHHTALTRNPNSVSISQVANTLLPSLRCPCNRWKSAFQGLQDVLRHMGDFNHIRQSVACLHLGISIS